MQSFIYIILISFQCCFRTLLLKSTANVDTILSLHLLDATAKLIIDAICLLLFTIVLISYFVYNYLLILKNYIFCKKNIFFSLFSNNQYFVRSLYVIFIIISSRPNFAYSCFSLAHCILPFNLVYFKIFICFSY